MYTMNEKGVIDAMLRQTLVKDYRDAEFVLEARSRGDILEVFLKKFFTGCSVLCGVSRPSMFVSSTSRANRHRTAVF
jgi:hypothetical protein